MSVMTIAILSLKSELLSQYRMPNALNIDVMSSNDTLDSILFHRDLAESKHMLGSRISLWERPGECSSMRAAWIPFTKL